MTRNTASVDQVLSDPPHRAHRVVVCIACVYIVLAVLVAFAYWTLRPTEQARATLDACVAAELREASAMRAGADPPAPDDRNAQWAAAVYACATQP
ncbi:hypothetical protein [Paraburkholderia sp.]|uniref:hypothetical protein n=1 Tax=Paraburkholderia sp. TaxID=1926495 RepID=UPI003D6F7AFA